MYFKFNRVDIMDSKGADDWSRHILLNTIKCVNYQHLYRCILKTNKFHKLRKIKKWTLIVYTPNEAEYQLDNIPTTYELQRFLDMSETIDKLQKLGL